MRTEERKETSRLFTVQEERSEAERRGEERRGEERSEAERRGEE